MKLECPKCKMVKVIMTSQIISDQNAFELSCPNCNLAMNLELVFSLDQTNPAQPRAEHADAGHSAPDPAQSEAERQKQVKALKTKILRSLVNLPPMPHIILKARQILSDPESSLKDLAVVIETDQALVAKVLTLANSAYYGVSGKISSIPHASVLLGQKTLGQMITISASSALLTRKLRGYGIDPDGMWKHSLACAFAAKRIAEIGSDNMVEDAFTAGLLHDAGKIILDPYVLKHKFDFKKLKRQNDPSLFEAERSIIGFDHAEIMSRACRIWRFPEDQIEAIRFHHQPRCSDETKLACIIHLADFLAKTAGFPAGPPGNPSQIAPDILELLKLQKENLIDLANAIKDDVRKIEEELQE